MKIEVLQENLSKAVSSALRFTSARAQLPVLGNLLLKVHKNKLLIASTNLEVSLAIQIGGKIEEEGEITVPARAFAEFVANLPGGAVTLSSDKEQLSISTGKINSVIMGMNAADFPAIPQKIDGGEIITFDKNELTESLNQVSFAVSTDETRPILTGVLFIFHKGNLTLVATDGFRLSLKKIAVKGFENDLKIILPKNPLMEISRLTEGNELIFNYKEKDNQVSFGFGDTVLSSRVLEGQFPDFEKIIPKNAIVVVDVDKEELLRVVKLAAVFARDSANIVKIFPKKGSVEIKAESTQSGNQKSTIEASVEGEGFEIAFNYKFLEDVLQTVKGESVKIELSTPNSPGVFTDTLNPEFLHIIMPVRIQN